MCKAKYGLVELTKKKLSCAHSKVLAQYFLDTLQRVDVAAAEAEQEDDSNENTESKNGMSVLWDNQPRYLVSFLDRITCSLVCIAQMLRR